MLLPEQSSLKKSEKPGTIQGLAFRKDVHNAEMATYLLTDLSLHPLSFPKLFHAIQTHPPAQPPPPKPLGS